MKIDAFCHIMPRPYYDRFFTLPETVHAANLRQRVANIPCLVDMDVRFAQMDEFGDYRQLINICAPSVEDLGSPEGTFVGGVRARRINVMHGDVVRLGRQLAVFVERDLAAYTGPVERSGGLVHGPKQMRDWIGPACASLTGWWCSTGSRPRALSSGRTIPVRRRPMTSRPKSS